MSQASPASEAPNQDIAVVADAAAVLAANVLVTLVWRSRVHIAARTPAKLGPSRLHETGELRHQTGGRDEHHATTAQ